ncbi:Scr1 family TA system antitoxin-like transcriptional regulator [Streptomyces sp. M10(2022)]
MPSQPTTPVVWALLDEAVLRRPVGGPEAMAEQVMHLVRVTETERVRSQALPFRLLTRSGRA